MNTLGFPFRPAMMRPHAAPAWTHPAAVMRPMMPSHANQQAVNRLAWRGRPAPVVNNYYTQPAPVTQQPPSVAMTTPAPTVVVPPSMPEPQPSIQPASATADLGPTQDAAAAAAANAVDASAPPAEHPGHSWGRKIIIGLVVAGVAFGGYTIYKHSKKSGGHGGGGHGHKHGLEGFRRRSRRRR